MSMQLAALAVLADVWPAVAAVSAFDGHWDVTESCPAAPGGALAYV